MMFFNWLNFRRRRHEVSPPATPKWSRRFSCSSFKDVHHLFNDVASPEHQVVHKPRSPKIHGYTSRTLTPTRTLFSTDHGGGVVLYYTSLNVVRKTFLECRAVRAIFHRLHVPIDERDLSMDAKFHEELHAMLGTKNVKVPKVFIGGRYVGGAEEINMLHETGELMKMVGELPPSDGRFSENCELCGGWRFVICRMCYGSHKIVSEENGFVSCAVCDEQGLVRCPSCFPMHRRRNTDISGRLGTEVFDN